MNTWTDSGLPEAGLIGAKLAVGIEARLPDGPARAARGGSRASSAGPDASQRRGGRRRAPESTGGQIAADRGQPMFGAPAADFAGSHAGSQSGSHAAVDVPATNGLAPGAAGPSSLTGFFPTTGAARLQTPAPVPLPAGPLPPEPEPVSPVPVERPVSSGPVSSERPLPARALPVDDRDGLRSSTDGFLAGGFSSSSSDSSWDIGRDLGSELSGGRSDSWSRPVPITPQRPIDPAVSARTRMVRESELSPAVSAPTSLLPMPKTAGSRHSAESHDHGDEDRGSPYGTRETFNVESSTLGSLDSSGLFAALSRRGG